jgi:radical SAM superfamily enzyme YgiQ (UPF0313 family)
MDFEGTTYRPPPEADTVLIQATVGCSNNRCSFCNMYRDVSFRVIGMDRIASDLKEAKYIHGRAERIFLVNGDVFVLSANKLKKIADLIRDTFPECQTITMYASISNIKTKTDEDLELLKSLGIDDLYIGTESGSDTVLSFVNKGHTVAEAKEQLDRLKKTGISYILNVMLGLAGAGGGQENARVTADFLNRTEPKIIWVGTTTIFEETELYREVVDGRFTPATEREILEEEKELINRLSLDQVHILGNHPSNSVFFAGDLPRDKERMIKTIEQGILHYGDETLSRPFHRQTL